MEELILKLTGILGQLSENEGVSKRDASVDKNIVKSSNSPLDNKKKTSSNITNNEKRRLTETFSLFNRLFFDYKKKMEPDKYEKAKISNSSVKQVTPPQENKEQKSKFGFGSILAGLLLVVGGIAAFITGLLSDGPFKGIMKLLSKFGLKGGIALITNAVKPFLKTAMRILKFPLKVLASIAKFFGKGFAGIGKFLFGGIGKQTGKFFAKLGASSIGKMLMKFLKPLAKVFKRIPIVGTILSIAFAYNRFNGSDGGDVVGGVIDVLSGLAGLVDLVLPGVGSAMSIGLDVLNAVLDSKADQGEGKPPRSKLTILKEMAASVGKMIWDKRMYIPILSSVNRFMMAWDSFKAGNIGDGFMNFGLALTNLVTGADGAFIMQGISGFMGLFSSDKKEGSKPKPNKSFISEMVSVVGEKIKGLWDWIKQYISDKIAEFIPGGEKIVKFASDATKEVGEVASFVGGKAKGAYNATKKGISDAWNNVIGGISGGFETISKEKTMAEDIAKVVKPDAKKKKKKEEGESIMSKMMAMFMGGEDATQEAEKKQKEEGESIMSKMMAMFMGGEDATQEAEKKQKAKSYSVETAKAKRSEAVDFWLERICKLQIDANQYLRMIASNTSNGSQGGHSFVSLPSPQSPPSMPSVPIPDNRQGYTSSAYALG